MHDLNDLLKPVWGVQKDVIDLWNIITPDEQYSIKIRMDNLFKNGLPFSLKHEKIIYIHLFMALAQIDIIACQVPLKFASKILVPEFEQRLRAQLLDEIFHVMLSIKIVYMLSNPHAYPPELNDNTKKFCEFIRKENCPKTAMILLNLITEGVAEELAKCFYHCGLAAEVFELILKDERRHVSDADLYFAMGLPDIETLQYKLIEFEEHILSSLIFQYNTNMSLITALGMDGMQNFLARVNHKYKEQLNKLNLAPGKKWLAVMHFFSNTLKNLQNNNEPPCEIEMTPLRKLSITQWNKPTDPTMVGQFNIDVTCLDFFEKKYPSDTLTILMLQTISQILADHPEYSLFLNDQKLFRRTAALVCLVVKLPDCGDHMGIITFQNCHNMSVPVLSAKIRQVVSMMAFCYKKREQLELEYPMLKLIQNSFINEMNDEVFRPILPRTPGVSLSNIGTFGYTQSKSPLLSNEAAKFTIMAVQRTPVWCQTTKTFIARDLLPVSVSTDHRIFGGNMPLPKTMDSVFQDVFAKMQLNSREPGSKTVKESSFSITKFNDKLLAKKINALLIENLQLGYMILMTLQTMWLDYLAVEDMFGALFPSSATAQSVLV